MIDHDVYDAAERQRAKQDADSRVPPLRPRVDCRVLDRAIAEARRAELAPFIRHDDERRS